MSTKKTLSGLQESDSSATALLKAIEKTQENPPKIGEYWPTTGGIYAGAIRYPNGEQYHLTLLDIEIPASEWGKYGTEIKGANSYHDGLANTAALRMAGSTMIAELDTATVDIADAYIPAIRELNIITTNLGVDLPKKWHWSSTQCSAYDAWLQDFSDGRQTITGKYYKLAARAVRRTLII